MNCTNKIVVFDLDETLGYFTELGMVWDALTNYIKNNNVNIARNQDLFNKILDLYYITIVVSYHSTCTRFIRIQHVLLHIHSNTINSSVYNLFNLRGLGLSA